MFLDSQYKQAQTLLQCYIFFMFQAVWVVTDKEISDPKAEK